MAQGNIISALNLLTSNMENGILPLNRDRLSKFIHKHPKGKMASQDILLNGPLQNIHPVTFQSMGSSIYYACKIFRKTNIFYPLIHTRTYAYQG